MTSNWALVNANIVSNVIVADQTFINTILNQYQFVVNLNGISPQPSPGWAYNGQVFSPPFNNGETVLSGENAIQLSPVTTSQRDANIASMGDVVFNSDVNQLQVYDGTKWNNIT